MRRMPFSSLSLTRTSPSAIRAGCTMRALGGNVTDTIIDQNQNAVAKCDDSCGTNPDGDPKPAGADASSKAPTAIPLRQPSEKTHPPAAAAQAPDALDGKIAELERRLQEKREAKARRKAEKAGRSGAGSETPPRRPGPSWCPGRARARR